MNQKHTLTEEEHIKLVEVGNEFYEKLGVLIAEAVNKMPKNLESITLEYLQERCSVYGSSYDEHLDKDHV